MTRDRYLNVDDPRDKAGPAPDAHPDPSPPTAEAPAVAGAPTTSSRFSSYTGREPGTEPAQPAPAPESEADRCLRVMREVLLSPPGPHDLVAGVAEVERRLREGGKP